MSRSRRKRIVVKDKTGRWYNKCTRRHQNQQVRGILTLADKLAYEISQSKELVNDWDVCDWKINFEKPWRKANLTKEELERYARK